MRLPIRYKLLLGFLVLFFLAGAVQAIIFTVTRNYIFEQISLSFQDKTHNAANLMEEFFSRIDNTTANLSLVYSKSNNSQKADLEKILSYEVNKQQYLRKVTFLSTTGKEIIEMTKVSQTTPDKLSFELPSPQFLNAVAGTASISKVYYIENEQGPHIDLFSPIYSSKETVAGVIKMQINLTKLWDVIADIRQGENGFAYVVDNEGRLIAHPNLEYVLKRPILTDRKIIKETLLANDSPQPTSLQRYTNEQNQEVIAQAVKIPRINWLIIFEEPAKEAYYVLDFIQNLFVIILVGSSLLILFLSLIISRGITGPILSLRRGTQEIEKGNLTARLSIKSGDEIELLAQSFNTMAQAMQVAFEDLDMQKRRSDNTAELLMLRDSEIREINNKLKLETEKLEKERDKLRLTLFGISDAVVSLDMEEKVIAMNKAASDMLEISDKDVVGKGIHEVMKLYEGEREILSKEYAPINDSKDEGVIYHNTSLKLVSKTKTHTVNIISGKISQGRIINLGCILTLHDVTKENQLEAMRLDFVSMAAHELRTPLTTIRSYLSVFIQENYVFLQDEQRMFISKIYSSTIQLAFLIENLLDVTKIEKGIFILNKEPLDWITYLRQMVKDFTKRATDKGITLEFIEPDGDFSKVDVDMVRINEVVLNILTNAINYTDSGGKITVSVEEKDGRVTTHIKDTGEGIAQDAIPHLFTKFFRIVGKLTQGSKGTGLGLFISKSIIEKHGGKIWVESEGLGKGSTFSFSLPTVKEKKG